MNHTRRSDEDVQARLSRIAGQVAGIQRMLEAERDCVDVLRQIAAVEAALHETGRVLLAAHVEGSLAELARSRDVTARRQRLDQLVNVFSRFCRVDEPALERKGA